MLVETPGEIFKFTKEENFKNILGVAYSVDNKVDVELLLKNYQSGNKNLDILLERWKSSLDSEMPDYSVYSSYDYLNEAFICWSRYSREYLLRIGRYLKKDDCKICNVNKVLDLGCGAGLTTVGLKALFRDAYVVGTNVGDSLQYYVAKNITDNIDGCDIVDNNFEVDGDVDLIFASEFFEHIEEPIEFLVEILKKYYPRYFFFANTFIHEGIGHFKKYKYYGDYIDGREIIRKFTMTLKGFDYYKVRDSSFYNNRPTLYMRL